MRLAIRELKFKFTPSSLFCVSIYPAVDKFPHYSCRRPTPSWNTMDGGSAHMHICLIFRSSRKERPEHSTNSWRPYIVWLLPFVRSLSVEKVTVSIELLCLHCTVPTKNLEDFGLHWSSWTHNASVANDLIRNKCPAGPHAQSRSCSFT